MSDVTTAPGLLATVRRGGLAESVHYGHVVLIGPDGDVIAATGSPGAIVYPRSALKPVQAAAMVEMGLDVPDEQLALACASHSGENVHIEGVRQMLADAGLPESLLQNTPALPFDPKAACQWTTAGHGKSSISQNCSGKHAAMLITSAANGWDLATYRSPDHPVQQGFFDYLADAGGEPPAAVTVDGCGAPAVALSLAGLARAVRAASAVVGPAMSTHPYLVGGRGREATEFMQAVPGSVAKDGAEGVFVVSLPDGTTVAAKAADGALRGALAGAAGALARVGVTGLSFLTPPVLGHGEPVGQIEPAP